MVMDQHDPMAMDGNDPMAMDGNNRMATDGDDPMAMDGNDPMAVDGNDPMAMDGDDTMAMDGDDTMVVDGNDTMAMNGDDPMAVDWDDPMAMDGNNPMAMDGDNPMAMDGDDPMAMVVEWIPTSHRAITVAITGFAYTLGQILLAGVAFAVPHWRRLQLTVSLPFFGFLLYSWFSISFSYYGLAMDLQNFGVSIYLIQVIFGAVDFPAKLVVTISLSYVGRRLSLMVALFLAGLAIIANIFVPTGECWGQWDLLQGLVQPLMSPPVGHPNVVCSSPIASFSSH
ncbi:hypothetical protein AAES_51683 [Amazona aestiva]|uniref:Uncharacterized protein n=1 Tax=Amazona aestiva TaxID=12930 RepID=A0A0Q3Q758_AMAAE|nr:hypothetical protein AAES_51683 [Amazona aestiva]